MTEKKDRKLPAKRTFVFVLDARNVDDGQVKSFIGNYNKYNADEILLYVINGRKELYWVYKGELCIVDVLVRMPNMQQYFGQQSVLQDFFGELELSENYCVVNTRYHFIRDFYLKDFLCRKNTPYYIVHDYDNVRSCDNREQIINVENYRQLQKMETSKDEKEIERVYVRLLENSPMVRQIPHGRLFYEKNFESLQCRIDCLQGIDRKTIEKLYIGYISNKCDGNEFVLNAGCLKCQMNERLYKLIKCSIAYSLVYEIGYYIRKCVRIVKLLLSRK